MILAIVNNNKKTRAFPSGKAVCPSCGMAVRAKCGKINVWHWAHEVKNNCNRWEPETAWHLEWKSVLPDERIEVRIKQGDSVKIADAVTKAGRVFEFQHSLISVSEIESREGFYKNMAWVFDCRDQIEKGQIELRHKGDYVTFRWKHPKKHIAHCKKPVYLDFGDSVLRLKAIYPDSPCGGWGYLRPKEELVKHIGA